MNKKDDFGFGLFSDLFTEFDRTMQELSEQGEKMIQRVEKSFNDANSPLGSFMNRHGYKKTTSDENGTRTVTETWTDKTGFMKFKRTVVTTDSSRTVKEEVDKPSIEELEKKMNEHAEKREFEEAARYRDIINKMKEASK